MVKLFSIADYFNKITIKRNDLDKLDKMNIMLIDIFILEHDNHCKF